MASAAIEAGDAVALHAVARTAELQAIRPCEEWQVLSGVSGNSDHDFADLSIRFQVPVRLNDLSE